MSKYLSKEGFSHFVESLADGTLVVGDAVHAANADVASSVAASNITGVLSISQLPKGAIEELKIVADDTARFQLTAATVQVGDTVKVESTGKMYFVIDDSKLGEDAGYEEYTAGTSTFAQEAAKVSHGFSLKLAGTLSATFDGSSETEVDVTPEAIGAATAAQGEKADNAVQKVNGKGLSTNDYTTSEKTKLSGIEEGAQKHVAPSLTEITTALGYTPLQSSDIAGKVDKVSGKGLSANDYTTSEKTKLGGIEEGAQKHIAPSLTEITSALGYTPLQSSDIAGKVDKVSGKGLSTNDYTTSEKTKLGGIEAGATADSAITNDEIDLIINNIMNNK